MKAKKLSQVFLFTVLSVLGIAMIVTGGVLLLRAQELSFFLDERKYIPQGDSNFSYILTLVGGLVILFIAFSNLVLKNSKPTTKKKKVRGKNLILFLVASATIFSSCSNLDDKFELVRVIELKVPIDYSPLGKLDSCAKNNCHCELMHYEDEKTFWWADPNVCSKNFSNPSEKIVPGETYRVKIFRIKKGESISSRKCIKFMEDINAHFFGAQGIALLWDQKTEEVKKLPMKGNYFSFDQKDNLFSDDRGIYIPGLQKLYCGDWNLRNFYWNQDHGDEEDPENSVYLICFL